MGVEDAQGFGSVGFLAASTEEVLFTDKGKRQGVQYWVGRDRHGWLAGTSKCVVAFSIVLECGACPTVTTRHWLARLVLGQATLGYRSHRRDGAATNRTIAFVRPNIYVYQQARTGNRNVGNRGESNGE